MSRFLLFGLVSMVGVQAATVAVDSERGEQLFVSLSCIQCHSVNGKGAKVAADLGRRIDRSFTPAALAATMWNHAPTMWGAMRERQIGAGDLNEQAAADLFAYFYSARFFDKPGDAGRGKELFSSKRCAQCHGLETPEIPEAKPVSQWESLGHPIVLATAMWNHGASMREEFDKRKVRRPELTAQDLSDILVYLRNLPATRNSTVQFVTSSGANGKEVFESKGCVKCHVGNLALPPRLKGKTLTEIAVDMWNHQPKMATVPAMFDAREMRELVSYLWAQQFFEDSGNPASGKRVFSAKHCATCHNDPSSGAPKLTGAGRSFSAVTMVSALWHHGPRMLEQMKSKGVTWPRFDAREMSDLIAHLNSPGR
jgi:mono/diheme cytochrome c family protein